MTTSGSLNTNISIYRSTGPAVIATSNDSVIYVLTVAGLHPIVIEEVNLVSTGTYNLDLVGPVGSGSCCLPIGKCTVTTRAACGGTWTDSGICIPNPCPPPTTPGACCFRNASCRILPPARCLALSGVFVGGVCTPSVDPPCFVPGGLKGSSPPPDDSAPAEKKGSCGQIKNRYR